MIIFKNTVSEYLDGLVYNLYNNEYFGFIESSEAFVDKLIDFITENIEIFPSKKTPFEIQYLSSNYIFYKSTNRTTWYIFFEQKDNNFVITYIINNNSEEVKIL
jgi:hypothetical protein